MRMRSFGKPVQLADHVGRGVVASRAIVVTASPPCTTWTPYTGAGDRRDARLLLALARRRPRHERAFDDALDVAGVHAFAARHEKRHVRRRCAHDDARAWCRGAAGGHRR